MRISKCYDQLNQHRFLMRILLLTGFPNPFSDALYLRLAQEQDFEIIHAGPVEHTQTTNERSGGNSSSRYRYLPCTLRSIGQAGDPHRVYFKPLHLYLRQVQPDLVVCQFEQESVTAAQASLVCALLGRGIPLTLYSWQNVLRNRSLSVRVVDYVTLRRASHVTCASTQAVDVLRRKGFRGTTSVAPLIGVDERIFYPRTTEEIAAIRAKYDIQGFAIGYAGRLVFEKSIDLLIKAFRAIKEPCTLVILGSGDQEDALKRMTLEYGIFDQCRFIPNVDYQQMPEHLSVLDVLVLPSRTTPVWKEQFGRVLVEAMACGIPVIGSDSGAIPEVIGKAGLIFPEGNSNELISKIQLVKSDTDLRNTLILCGFERVNMNYTIERLASQTANLWRSLIHR